MRKLRTLNIICIVWFILSIWYFGWVIPTQETDEVLNYFIPDTILALMNILMTFYAYNEISRVRSYLNKWIVLIINLGYYINIASAFWYLGLFIYMGTLDKDNSSQNYQNPESFIVKNCRQFNESMKYKISATFHAIYFKLYAYALQKQQF